MEEFKPRDCVKVIKDMLALIPIEEKELIQELNKNMEDAFYKAPEETIQWKRTGRTLQNFITLPKKDWEFEVLSIFSTLSVEEIRQQVKDIN